MSGRALQGVELILERGGDPDDVLRAVVRTLAEEPGISWAGISFLEDGSLVLGPEAGTPEEARRHRVPVSYRGERVGELAVDGAAEQEPLERLAALVAEHVLLGWDTGGQTWEP